jgi:3-methyladenine DNA glycosylase/8-oxoguanine DNA glycosylase
VLEVAIPVTGPLDLRETLTPLHGRFERDGWWFSERGPEGPATLQVSRARDRVVGRAWGAGGAHLLGRLPEIVGLDDDPGTFQTSHPRVRELHRRNPGLRIGASRKVFDELVIAIVGQKVTGGEAARAMSGLHRLFSEPAPGPNPRIRLPPDPDRMAEAPYWQFHEIHLEQRRAQVLKRAAGVAGRIDGLRDVGAGEAAASLRMMPGIGEWTAAEVLVRSHGDGDQVSVGDYHLKNMVVYHLTGRPRGSDEEMVELLEEFRPHRARVVRLLHKLGHAPKYGPRSTPRNITSI